MNGTSKKNIITKGDKAIVSGVNLIEFEHNYKNKINHISDFFKVFGGSVRGKSHIKDDKPRDDSFNFVAINHKNTDYYVFLVSDGAGSKQLSRFGSCFSVNKLSEIIHKKITSNDFLYKETIEKIDVTTEKNLENNTIIEIVNDKVTEDEIITNKIDKTEVIQHYKNLMSESFKELHQNLDDFSKGLKCELKDLSCTLLSVIYIPSLKILICGQIGDGFIVALKKSGKACQLVNPTLSEEIGATYFITMPTHEKYESFEVFINDEIDDIKTIFIATDGVSEDAIYSPPENLLDMWSDALDKNIRSEDEPEVIMEKFLKWLSTYEAKGSFDDRTLFIVAMN